MALDERALSPLAQAGRAAWSALEPLHTYLYFAPVAAELFAAAGLSDKRDAYFGARLAAVGAIGPMPVTAMLYNFSPFSVHRAVPHIWEILTPATARDVRVAAVDEALAGVLGEAATSPQVHEALALARAAADGALRHPQGRAMFCAHAELPWPDAPHAQLWHAQTLLREFRGDGHNAALLRAGVTGLEALVLYTATEKIDGDQLRLTRGWNRGEWDACAASLVERGLLEPGTRYDVTPAGARLRQAIEDATDVLAEPAYAAIGRSGCQRLAELSLALNEPVVQADVIPWLRSRVAATRRNRVRRRVESRTVG